MTAAAANSSTPPATSLPEQLDATTRVLSGLAATLTTLSVLARIAAAVRGSHPTAATLVLSTDDATATHVAAYDARGVALTEHLGEVFHVLGPVPDRFLDPRTATGSPSGQHEVSLSLAALTDEALAAEAQTAQMSLAEQIIGRCAHTSFVIDDAVIREQVGEEVGFGTLSEWLGEAEAGPTEDEMTQICAAFDASAVDRAMEAVFSAFHYQTQRAAEQVLARTRG